MDRIEQQLQKTVTVVREQDQQLSQNFGFLISKKRLLLYTIKRRF